jgi:competence protein ComEC
MAVAMMVGIAVSHADLLPMWVWAVVMGVAALAGGLLTILKKREFRVALTLLLTLTFVAIGALRILPDDAQYDPRHWTHLVQQPSFLTLRLTETPTPRERSWKTEAEVLSVDSLEAHGTLHLFLRKDSTAATLHYGDTLTLHGYADTTRGTLYVTSDHYLIAGHDSTSPRAHCEAMRMKLLRRMQHGPLEHRHAGVAEAMTLGWRGDLEPDLQAQFRAAGIMHLLCVSGLHVGLLAVMVGGLFLWLGEERRGRILRGSLQLLVLWGFALLTGLAPATVRAALMFSLFIISHMMGRRTDSLNLLSLAAIVMLMVDPLLLFNTGWQLSFCAVAGILLARPAIQLFHNPFWQTASVCLAATLATLPVILSSFHTFQPYFLIANIIIVPLAALILVLSLLYMLLPCPLFASPLWWLLESSDRLTGAISRLPGATINNIEISPIGTTFLTVAIFFILFAINAALQRYNQRKNLPLC